MTSPACGRGDHGRCAAARCDCACHSPYLTSADVPHVRGDLYIPGVSPLPRRWEWLDADGRVVLQCERLAATRMRAIALDGAGNPAGDAVELPVPTDVVITRTPYR